MNKSNELIKNLDMLEMKLLPYFTKSAPALPKGLIEFLVKVAPYLVILSLIFTIPALIAMSTAFNVASTIPAMGYGTASSWSYIYYLSMLQTLIIAVIQIFAVKGLLNKEKSAWNLIFYSMIVSLIFSLLSMNLFGFVLQFIIGFYFLFQVRSEYK